MTKENVLYIVHCIDTEGPLNETLNSTFERLESIFGIKLKATKRNLELIQNKEIDLSGKEEAVAKCFSKDLLSYNSNWMTIDLMLDELLSEEFRNRYLDDYGSGWTYSWHCMDHMGYLINPRNKDVGYGNIFRYYKSKLEALNSQQDEINWHFHPLSLTRNPTQCATSYVNSYDILTQILSRRIIDDGWFPVVNRPGFHAERPDSHAFLEQWIPFDYANQHNDEYTDQPDLSNERFGDWSRAPKSWRGYNPHHDDYQEIGTCRRRIFRCLNVGTRFNCLQKRHVEEALAEAQDTGGAILSFSNHDYRDMRPDVKRVQKLLQAAKKGFPNVLIRYAGAEEAAISLLGFENKIPPKLSIYLKGNTVIVEAIEGEIFGPQPFLAIKTREGSYYHDNFYIIEPQKKWSYYLDSHTLVPSAVESIGAGTAGRYGKSSVVKLNL